MTNRILRTPVLVFVCAAVPTAAMAQSPDLRTVEFQSPAVGRTMKYNILLLRDYESSNQQYPVLYLLHGVNEDYTSWVSSSGTRFASTCTTSSSSSCPTGATPGM